MKDLLYQFIEQHKLAVVSTVSSAGRPEAAVIGIGVTRELEIVFDTVISTRKYKNILHDPHVALAIGWDGEITVQYEGEATVLLDDAEGDRYREVYYKTYPDGRNRAATWAGLVHIKVTPKWIRYSNFNEPVIIEEINL
jgi:general stress protein 26